MAGDAPTPKTSIWTKAKALFGGKLERAGRELDEAFATERELVEKRRKGIAGGEAGGAIEGDHFGLALSGGGIRSATFSLGVLQALSRVSAPKAPANTTPLAAPEHSLLARFDYLSTVSGGGYIGAFFGSLFMPNRLRRQAGDPKQARRAAAVDAYRVFQYEPPGRIRSADNYQQLPVGGGPLALLRESGRYLAPGGAGDLVYVLALAIRNWFAVHYVLGTFLAAAFALLAFIRIGLVDVSNSYAGFEDYLLDQMPCAAYEGPCVAPCEAACEPKCADGCAEATGCEQECTAPSNIWWSPFWAVPLLVIAVWLAPAFTAFWLTHPRKREDDSARPGILSAANWAALGIAGVCAIVALSSPLVRALPQSLQLFEDLKSLDSHLYVVVTVGFITLLALLCHALTARAAPTITAHRVALTRIATSACLALVAATVVAIVDTLSQTVYFHWASGPDRTVAETLSPGVIVAAVVWLFRRVAALADGQKTSGFLTKIPVGVIAGVAGMLLFFAIATLWGFFVQWIVWRGTKPFGIPGSSIADIFLRDAPGDPFGGEAFARFVLTALCAAALLSLAFVSGRFSGFLNLSSLQSFYGARLTRAYLGASNGTRFEKTPGASNHKELSAAEPVLGDQIGRDDYYSESLAPLHIINVTLNQTIDPAERLVQRDRKGKPLAVLPSGFSIDRTYYDFRDDPNVKGSINNGKRSQKLTIGQWIGTSGAAFTTGLGRSTSLGTSIALGLANVRLGMWWSSGYGDDKAHAFSRIFKSVFKTQTFLFYELTATFHGLRREWQYLSDGGHFENTALYELLRPGRGLKVIVVCDNGCDPRYRFTDVATLIRTARIDHRVRIEEDEQIAAHPQLGRVFGTRDEFQKLTDAVELTDGERRTLADKCALLLNAYNVDDSRPAGAPPDCRIVVLKPRVISSVPIDVAEYHATHPDFPQQSTTDQFFDEAQWESYRCLGSCIGQRVFAVNGAALWTYLQQ
jgi:hypothetical protein